MDREKEGRIDHSLSWKFGEDGSVFSEIICLQGDRWKESNVGMPMRAG